MGKETDEIKQHIADERDNLGRNFDEIEYRFKDATDLKANFDRHTGWILGAAVAGGVLLSLACNRSDSKYSRTNWQSKERNTAIPTQSLRAISLHLNRVSETVDDILAGLVGVFSNKLQSLVADTVPGFREQYSRINQRDPSVPHARSMAE